MPEPAVPARRGIPARGIIGILIAILMLIFIFQNFASVPVQFLFFGPFNLPLWLVLIVTFVLGMLLGGMVRTGFRKLRGKETRPR